MIQTDKKTLLLFISRTGMYIYPQDSTTITSFITGYEVGRNKECNFAEQLKQLLADKYKIPARNTGWEYQIQKLAEKRSSTWTSTFNRIALEIIANPKIDEIDDDLKAIIKSYIVGHIKRIEDSGNFGFNNSWVEQWLTFCVLKSKWFKTIWTKKELEVIKTIDKEIQINNIFKDINNSIPTDKLVLFRKRYNNLEGK